MKRLIAHGVFLRKSKEADLHLAVLEQLTPDLSMPSLQVDFNPATPQQTPTSADTEDSAWTSDLQLFVMCRERVLDAASENNLAFAASAGLKVFPCLSLP